MSHAYAQASGALGRRRPELDGVRAFAVLAVFLFHNGVPWARGGYLGVDTFFVLSGFLITTLLLREVDTSGRVALLAFWGRRIRRLFPALLVMVLVVTVVLAHDAADPYPGFRADVFATLLYVANWHLAYGPTGYFAQYVTPSPLQHTWSLAVEEQFYALWPPLFIAATYLRLSHRRTAGVIAALAVASAALMALLYRSGAGTNRVFYGTDTRGFSLLIGVLLAYLLFDRRAVVLSPRGTRAATAVFAASGLGLAVGWATLSGTSALAYHGGIAVFAVLSAVAVGSLVVAPDGWHCRALAVWPLRSLGRISYGFYLWHWPVLLAMTGARTGLYGWPLVGARFGVTLALATASWWLLERPILARRWSTAVAVPAVAVALAATVAVVFVVTDAPLFRPTSAQAAGDLAPLATTPSTAAQSPDASGRLRVVVLGDSVASSLAVGMRTVQTRYGLAVTDGGIIGCGVSTTPEYRLTGVTGYLADTCSAWESTWQRSVAASRAQVALVVIGRHEVWDAKFDGRWTSVGDPAYDAYLDSCLSRALAVAGSGGARVVFATSPYYQRPEQPDGRVWPENEPARVDAFNALLRSFVAAHAAQASLLDLGGHVSPGGRYASTVDGVLLRSDGVHFTVQGAAWLTPWIAKDLREPSR